MKIEVHTNKTYSSSESEKELYNGTVKLECLSTPKFGWIKTLSFCCGIVSIIACAIVLAICKPRTNLSFDYMGAIIATASLVVAVFVAVQIYQSFTLKREIDESNQRLLERSKDDILRLEKDLSSTEQKIDRIHDKIKEIASEEIKKQSTILNNKIDRNFITEETSILVPLLNNKEWDKALPFVRICTLRHLRLVNLGCKDLNIEMFSNVVAQMINDADVNFLNKPDFSGFMELFNELGKYENHVYNVYKMYNDKINKTK